MQELVINSKIIFDPKNVTNKHVKQSSWKKHSICNIIGDIDLYYAWFLKKRFNLELNRSIRGAHITIINDRIEDFDLKQYDLAKSLFNNKPLKFTYYPDEIRSNGKHWWLKVYSDEAKAIREFIGLNREPYTPFHLTLGYSNEKNEYHSKYILKQIIRFGL